MDSLHILNSQNMTVELFERNLKYVFDNKPENETFIYHNNTDKFAIIIEPRFDDITEQVIYNFMHFLNPLGWNLIVISYYGHHKMIQQKLPYALIFDIGDNHIFFDSSGNPNISIASYNTILFDQDFWKNILGETIIIFQRDCIMFRMFSEHFLLYDYAGSNYLSNMAPQFGGINGGFSIRKRKTMIECLEKISWEDIDEYRRTRKYAKDGDNMLLSRNEDVFFTHACEILCKDVPDVYSRTFLCIENDFNLIVSVHHGWNKRYTSYENAYSLLKSSPLFEKVPSNWDINEFTERIKQ